MISLTNSKWSLIARVIVLVFAFTVGFIALYLAIVGKYILAAHNNAITHGIVDCVLDFKTHLYVFNL